MYIAYCYLGMYNENIEHRLYAVRVKYWYNGTHELYFEIPFDSEYKP